MDYLPRPPRSTRPHLKVPFVATIPFDDFDLRQPIRSFASRHRLVVDGKWDQSRSLGRQASGLQSWLFFGVLSKFADSTLRLSDFSQPSDIHDGFEVSTSTLSWLHNGTTGPTQILHTNRHLKHVLKQAWKDLMHIESMEALSAHPFPVILLSVKLLLLVLGFRIDPNTLALGSAKGLGSQDAISPTSTKALGAWMTALGGCPFLIRQLCTRFDVLTLYYMSFDIDHGFHGALHSACSPSSCIAYHTDKDNYRTRHISRD